MIDSKINENQLISGRLSKIKSNIKWYRKLYKKLVSTISCKIKTLDQIKQKTALKYHTFIILISYYLIRWNWYHQGYKLA